jgi:hypothetical protein
MRSASNLPGGYVTSVTRLGGTVLRDQSPNAEFVHSLLLQLEQTGYTAAPRFLGIDANGKEVLSFIEGHVAWEAQQPPGVWSNESLLEIARLTRRLHDLTAGTPLAGDSPVVCHNDLAPRNTVYRDLGAGFRPVAFIDWDVARPGHPEDDLAQVFSQYLCPCERHPRVDVHAKRINMMLDAYGYEGVRTRFIPLIEERMRDCITGIEREAAAGSAGHKQLIATGALETIRSQADWIAANGNALRKALTRAER